MDIAFYIDGADEVSPSNCLIKGGGGAHTREKIVASASNEFVCIVDDSKLVSELGDFPLPVEVIPESRSLVARKIVSMGGTPIYRSGFVTDQGNHILDVKDLTRSASILWLHCNYCSLSSAASSRWNIIFGPTYSAQLCGR